MINIKYDQKGFLWHQKRAGEEFEQYFDYNDVTSKKGYYKSYDYVSLIASFYLFYLSVKTFFQSKFTIFLLIMSCMAIYFLFNFFKSMKTYISIKIKSYGYLYIPKKQRSIVDNLFEKRNKYFFDNYYLKIENYSLSEKKRILEWLKEEKVITTENNEFEKK